MHRCVTKSELKAHWSMLATRLRWRTLRCRLCRHAVQFTSLFAPRVWIVKAALSRASLKKSQFFFRPNCEHCRNAVDSRFSRNILWNFSGKIAENIQNTLNFFMTSPFLRRFALINDHPTRFDPVFWLNQHHSKSRTWILTFYLKMLLVEKLE